MTRHYIQAAQISNNFKINYPDQSNMDALCIGLQIPPVPIQNILFIESYSNYSIFYMLGGQRVITSKTLKYWQEKLIDSHAFIRCHASFLVNKNCIHSFDRSSKSLELCNNSSVICSRRKWREVVKELKNDQSIQWFD